MSVKFEVNAVKAVIIGATGVVGRELVKLLLQSKKYEQISVVVRKKLSIVHPRLMQYRITMDELNTVPANIFEKAHVFCTLGTTMKQAKTKEKFKEVDFEYVLKFAQLAKQHGLSSFTLISAMGADTRSLFFYNRVKGEIEQALLELELPKLYVVRPSLIIATRQEKRWGESFAIAWSQKFRFIFKGRLKKYAPVHAKRIAEAMYKVALLAKEPYLLIQSHQIEQWAKRKIT